MSERFVTAVRTREARDHIEWTRAQQQKPVRVSPPARPLASYGVATVECSMNQRARLPLASCQRRWTIANRPAKNTSSARTGGFESDLRSSHCNGCTLGAQRCGKTVKARKAVTDLTRKCRKNADGYGGCGALFSPDREAQVRCHACIDKEHAAAGARA